MLAMPSFNFFCPDTSQLHNLLKQNCLSNVQYKPVTDYLWYKGLIQQLCQDSMAKSAESLQVILTVHDTRRA